MAEVSSISDALVHLGRGPDENGRPVNLPISQGSTMLFNSLSEFEAAREARHEPGTLYYGRYGNPASFELEHAIATLEGGAGCISVSAGLTAVTLALMGAAKAGDHLLVADNVYAPTRGFCDTVLARYGVEISYFDPMQDITPCLRPNTAAVMFEAPVPVHSKFPISRPFLPLPDTMAPCRSSMAHGPRRSFASRCAWARMWSSIRGRNTLVAMPTA